MAVKPNADTQMSMSQLSLLTGLDRRTIQRYLSDIDPVGKLRGYPTFTTRILISRIVGRNTISQYSQEDGPLNPDAERARKDKELADKYALENRVRRGELLEAAEVEAKWSDMVIYARTRLLSMPKRLAQQVAGETDPASCEKLMTEVCDEALRELSENDDDTA